VRWETKNTCRWPTLSVICVKNLCKRTVLVQLIIKKWSHVFGTQCMFVLLSQQHDSVMSQPLTKQTWSLTGVCSWHQNVTRVWSYVSHFLSTRLQVRPLNGFLQLIALKMRIYARMCLLGVSMMNNHIYGFKVPQALPHFGGLNRHFKPHSYLTFFNLPRPAATATA